MEYARRAIVVVAADALWAEVGDSVRQSLARLLAPGRPKYEYLIQFRTVFDSFECAGAQQ